MKRFLRNTLLLGVAAISLKGCIFDPETKPPITGGEAYKSPTAPESLVANLQISYRRREIEEYAKILAPEFKFVFQPVDQNTIGAEFWTFDQDSTGTRGLFTTPEVTEIRIDLIHDPSELSNEQQHQIDHPGARRILIKSTQLEVDQVGGITYLVTDQQEMFFYRGDADAGQDTTRWFLFEWRDLPALEGAPGLLPASVAAGTPGTQVLGTSWGSLLEGSRTATP